MNANPADVACYAATGLILALGVAQIITSEWFADALAWMQIQSAATAEMFEFITAIPEIR